jgi:hypothetical protein
MTWPRLRQEYEGYIYDWDRQRMLPSLIFTGGGLLAAAVVAAISDDLRVMGVVAVGLILGIFGAKAAASCVYMWTVPPKSVFWPDFPGQFIGPTFISRRQLADEEKHYVLLRRRNVVVGLLAWIIPAAVLVGVPVAITVAWHRLMPNGI